MQCIEKSLHYPLLISGLLEQHFGGCLRMMHGRKCQSTAVNSIELNSVHKAEYLILFNFTVLATSGSILVLRLTHCMLGSFACFCRMLFLFQNLVFLQKNLSITSVINSLDPDQARLFVEPDLDLDCLQRLHASADNKCHHKHSKSKWIQWWFINYHQL